ncbi:diphosphomevalonate decarboxylase [Marinobacterium weihaiense]|uniref:Diphosphomevalonate decarboxylase n=1 Tax=Marinobacterium weihaiense TaxID=2851016 RepID=A0ABS6MA62_9GAMM|nr:diphosphomevalonate decarboxylase [Marinobacterium weihaiense]MBV0933171.1 diphosphomevalonate decarboxylase [Marinobacterium weihaiense]
MKRTDVLDRLVPRVVKASASAEQFAPSNIALCKYWGKRDRELNLPINASLSVSLDYLGSHTRLIPVDGQRDEVWLNGQQLQPGARFSQKVSAFIDLFRRDQDLYFRVETRNNIPTAAGLASSASGFAALTLALNDALALDLPPEQLSILARMGSGSACRSLFTGFVQWNMGLREDGMDSHGIPLARTWPGFCIGLVEIDAAEKATDSRSGMQRTVETAHLYQSWPLQAAADLSKLQQAIEARDFELLGQTAEQNALSMHATMIASWPPLLYWQPESVAAMQKVWQLRAEGMPVYFTMDAGPNLKLLFQREDRDALLKHFPGLETVEPFGP